MKLPWGLRWWELLPEVVLALALGVFLITEPSAATSAFNSTTAIGLMAVVVVVWLVGRFLLVRYSPWPVLRLVVFSLAAAGVAAVVVVPAYDDTTVVESLPVARSEPNPVVPPRQPDGSAASPEPVAVRSSAIHGIDHRARGTAVVYRQPDGSLLVGLEDIDIQPGPDYDLYVVPGADRESISHGIRLDDLRGNKGTQYYPVPSGTNVITGRWTVLVWCQTFDVPVAGATPA